MTSFRRLGRSSHARGRTFQRSESVWSEAWNVSELTFSWAGMFLENKLQFSALREAAAERCGTFCGWGPNPLMAVMALLLHWTSPRYQKKGNFQWNAVFKGLETLYPETCLCGRWCSRLNALNVHVKRVKAEFSHFYLGFYFVSLY